MINEELNTENPFAQPLEGIGEDMREPDLTQTPSVAGRLRQLGGGNLVLVGLFVAGILCVYFLSIRKGPSAASAEQLTAEAKVDVALNHIRKETGDRAGRPSEAMAVVKTFYHETGARQIPASKLNGNPFAFKPPGAEEPAATDTRESGFSAFDSPVYVQSLGAVERLQLQSILKGPNGSVAMISNNLLTEGQMIEGWKIVKIQPREVILSGNGRQYVLKMQQ